MKRITGVIVAVACVLGFSTASSAVQITYNLEATFPAGYFPPPNGQWPAPTNITPYYLTAPAQGFSVSDQSPRPLPLAPSNTFGRYFTFGFLPGSTLTLETDTNGDYVVGDVSVVSSDIHQIAVTTLFGGAIIFYTDTLGHFTGGAGTLTGSDILWTSPVAFTYAGEFHCGDFGVPSINCTTISMTNSGTPDGSPGPDYTIDFLSVIGNTTVNTEVDLGTWNLSADLQTILGSTNAQTSFFNATGPSQSSGYYHFGPYVPPVPEPGAAALLLLGLGGLALRSRKV